MADSLDAARQRVLDQAEWLESEWRARQEDLGGQTERGVDYGLRQIAQEMARLARALNEYRDQNSGREGYNAPSRLEERPIVPPWQVMEWDGVNARDVATPPAT